MLTTVAGALHFVGFQSPSLGLLHDKPCGTLCSLVMEIGCLLFELGQEALVCFKVATTMTEDLFRRDSLIN